MSNNRIVKHPILPIKHSEKIFFYWNGKQLSAKKGEVISSALFAHDIKIFGHHPKDKSAQGIFCANGQCAKCSVMVDGVSLKSCMTTVKAGMQVSSIEGLPVLPETTKHIINEVEELEFDVLIIGGGPAGLSAAIQLGNHNINTLIVDDKIQLGGKLVLQTHKFFGSVEDSFAGTRGNDIGRKLAKLVEEKDNIEVWPNSTALYVYKDKKVGVLKNNIYKLIKPQIILNTAGAREKFLSFKGNSLAGIYGAGAFQTLVNRDLVSPAKRLFIVGGGNVGLIAGYHALQAGIDVVGLVEVMPSCGGYKVHADKLARLGVPIFTSHTVAQANGDESVESVTIAEVDKNFKPKQGTEKTIKCDTLLIAVGLESVSEFAEEAKNAGIKVFSAGDAKEIAEASSAMFNGKIAGVKVAKEINPDIDDIPENWYQKAEILKKEAGRKYNYKILDQEEGVFPIIHCLQEIPCNPCSTICPTNSINMENDPLMDLPVYKGKCIGCGKCVTICPGLAITLVDYRENQEFPKITLPYELSNYNVDAGDTALCVDIEGNELGYFRINNVLEIKSNKTQLIKLIVPKVLAKKIVSFRVQKSEVSRPVRKEEAIISESKMVCLCERVTEEEIRKLIAKGITDLNQIKAITRAGMGPCGAKSCDSLIKQIFKQEGIEPDEIVENTRRPIFVEVPLGIFAKGGKK
ncbi:MAG: FAD-dependent oxidoreductase [Candidatus Cloacimonetes bacterium]|nr:FAD-dependent oxidoreductase [Candidatus Cloacimonadota bacterium]